jgi:hypothetical protein
MPTQRRRCYGMKRSSTSPAALATHDEEELDAPKGTTQKLGSASGRERRRAVVAAGIGTIAILFFEKKKETTR